MKKQIGLIYGDGIGPEIVTQAVRILDKIAVLYHHEFIYKSFLMGGESCDKYGVPLTDEALQTAVGCDAILLGSVGGPKWEHLPGDLRPEKGLLSLRKALGLFANLRPAFLNQNLANACPLRRDKVEQGFDIMVVRELTGGLYFGERYTKEVDGVRTAVDTLKYDEKEIERIAIKAFEIARKRNKKVTSVDKANVLDSSRLWREVVSQIAKSYPDIVCEHMLVDNAAMQLIQNPNQFDVLLTENMFGDILSDEASVLTGSIGMLSSASLNETKFGLYEPSHGSAPDIAGQNKANPIATVLSASMLLRYSFDMFNEADSIERAVQSVLDSGFRTSDIWTDGCRLIGCSQMGDALLDCLQK